MNIAASGIISSSGVLSRNGDAITIDVDGTLTHNGQIKSSGTGASNSAGGSAANVTITATTIAGTGSFNLSGANGANGTRNNGHGKNGGDGAHLLVTSGYESLNFTIDVSGGDGGRKYGTSVYIKNGTKGSNGTYQFMNNKDLLIESGVTITVTAEQAATLETVDVRTGGVLNVPSGITLNLTSLTTKSSSRINNSGTINSEGITLSGGNIDNRNGTITSSDDIDVAANTNIEGTLNADLDINIDAKLGTVAGITGTDLVLNGRNIYVNSAGEINASGNLNGSTGGVIRLNATTNTVIDGDIVSRGASSGNSAGNVTITSGFISGTGTFNLSGLKGANGSYNSAHGKPGGDGGILYVESDYDSIEFTINVAAEMEEPDVVANITGITPTAQMVLISFLMVKI